jgi:hypothetical protein
MGSIFGGGGGSTSSSTSSSSSYTPRAVASPQEIELGKVAGEQYADYGTRFKPLNQRLLDLVHTDVSRDVRPAMARAGVDTRLAMAARKPPGLHQGVLAGSGAALLGQNNFKLIKGAAVGDAQGGAYRGAYDKEFTGLQKLAAQGRDIQDSSVMSLSAGGRRASEAAIKKAGQSVAMSGTSERTLPGEGWGDSAAMFAGALGRYMFSPAGGTVIGSKGTPSTEWDVFGETPPWRTADTSAGSGGGTFFSNLGSGLSNFGSTLSDGLSSFGSALSSGVSSGAAGSGANWFLGEV